MGCGGPWQGHTVMPFEEGPCLRGMWWCPGVGHGSAHGRGNVAVPWGGAGAVAALGVPLGTRLVRCPHR